MTTKTEIAVRSEAPQSIADLEQSFAVAVRQRELLEEYIQKRLTPGKHFYQIAGSKNSLTKEGAELICLPHGYRPSYFKEGGPDQPPEDNSPYQITVRCQLRKADAFAGEGIGSASSYITTKEGVYKPRQKDPGLCHNATLKVAQKSAYIAATLNATAASEFFTQDAEDGAETGQDSPKTVDAKLLCPIHKVEWFKRGNMQGFAHPIGEKNVQGKYEGWCNRSDVQKGQVEKDKDDLFGPEQTQPTGPQDKAITKEPATLKTLGDLYTAGRQLGYRTKKDMLAAIGVADDTLIGDLDEAFKKLQEKKP